MIKYLKIVDLDISSNQIRPFSYNFVLVLKPEWFVWLLRVGPFWRENLKVREMFHWHLIMVARLKFINHFFIFGKSEMILIYLLQICWGPYSYIKILPNFLICQIWEYMVLLYYSSGVLAWLGFSLETKHLSDAGSTNTHHPGFSTDLNFKSFIGFPGGGRHPPPQCQNPFDEALTLFCIFSAELRGAWPCASWGTICSSPSCRTAHIELPLLCCAC